MQKSKFIMHWKEQMLTAIRLKYADKHLNEKKLDKLLNKLIEEKINNRACSVVNNYTNNIANTNILSLIDLIEENNLIVTGGGCLFLPHGTKRNLLYEFIQYIKGQRNLAKKRRKQYEKGTFEWVIEDIAQGNFKLVVNSAYGCLGYRGFILFNIFIAEAITNEGRLIITSCIACFENYMGGAVTFTCEGEMIQYIMNIHNEYTHNGYEDTIDPSIFDFGGSNFDYREACIDRLLNKSVFEVTNTFKNTIRSIVYQMPIKEVIVLYYKNNLRDFNENSFMKDNFKYIMDRNGNLVFGSYEYLKDDKMRDCAKTVFSIYQIFVIYNYPTFDKVRKAMYQIKTKSLYTDTDSAFISLAEFVHYTLRLYNNHPAPGLTLEQTKTTGAFLHFIFVDIVVDMALKALCASQNIPPEQATLLIIKNEFFYSRIVFLDVKKRYIANALFQEGQMLGKGKGDMDIKGLDFKKSTTNAYLKQFFTKITEEDILFAEEIKPRVVFRKMIELKGSIETGIRNGERRFFKQSSVKLPEYYKNPYSTQGIIATTLWNLLCPNLAIELPSEIYVVPIKSLKFDKPPAGKVSTKTPMDYKPIADFAAKYPDLYHELYQQIYCNENALIRHMSLNYIAIPRNENVKVPEHVYDLIDFDKIINDALNLYLPVMESIGLKSLPTSGTVSHMSNIVQL